MIPALCRVSSRMRAPATDLPSLSVLSRIHKRFSPVVNMSGAIAADLALTGRFGQV